MFFFYCTICSKMSNIVVSVALFQPIFPHPVFFYTAYRILPHSTASYRFLLYFTAFYRLGGRYPIFERKTIGKRSDKVRL